MRKPDKHVVRLFEGSIEALDIAVNSLGSSKRAKYKTEAMYAPEIGLVGVAAELAMSACLVFAHGEHFLQKNSANLQFRTFPEIVDHFRSLVRGLSGDNKFMYKSVVNQAQHQNNLIDQTLQFKMIGNLRATSLHGAIGVNREVTVFQANVVSNLLELLSQSADLSEYLYYIPRCHIEYTDKYVLVEQLTEELDTADGDQRVTLLRSIFLLLPEIPRDYPEWLDKFERLTVTPKENDLVFLINALKEVIPVYLRRASGGTDYTMYFKIDNSDLTAPSIQMHQAKTKLTEFKDRWYARIGLANGDLEEDVFNIVPRNTLIYLFHRSLKELDLVTNDGILAVQNWVYVASCLAYQGTPLPCFFLLDETRDLESLPQYLQRASQCKSGTFLSKNIEKYLYIDAIEALRKNKALATTHPLAQSYIDWRQRGVEYRLQCYERFEYYNKYKGDYEIPEHFGDDIRDFVENPQIPVRDLFNKISKLKLPDSTIKYWQKRLLGSALNYEDREILCEFFTDNLSHVTPEIRRAIFCMDFAVFGNEIEGVEKLKIGLPK